MTGPKPMPHETPDHIIELMDSFLDAATAQYHDAHSDETFTACNVCGKWEEHHPSCPVPVVEAWFHSTPGAPPKA